MGIIGQEVLRVGVTDQPDKTAVPKIKQLSIRRPNISRRRVGKKGCRQIEMPTSRGKPPPTKIKPKRSRERSQPSKIKPPRRRFGNSRLKKSMYTQVEPLKSRKKSPTTHINPT